MVLVRVTGARNGALIGTGRHTCAWMLRQQGSVFLLSSCATLTESMELLDSGLASAWSYTEHDDINSAEVEIAREETLLFLQKDTADNVPL